MKLVRPDQAVQKPPPKGAPLRGELASQVEALIRERDRLIANEIHLFETIDVLRQRTIRVLMRQEVGRLLRRYGLFPLADRLRRAVARLRGKKTASSFYPAPTLSFNAAVVEHGPFLISGNGDASEALAVSVRAAGQNMIRVYAGDGFAVDADRSRLEEAKPGSLAAFLSDRMDHLGIVKTIVMDAAADAMLLGLLKGRLQPRQRLLLSNADQVAELSEPGVVEHGFALFETLPDAWLDPLDDARVPIASRIATVAWPKISVVMVSFNQAQFVEEAIRSILDQHYPNLELIVIDGQSDDGSIEILERYRSHFDVLVIEPDEGQTDGLNKGLIGPRVRFSLGSTATICWSRGPCSASRRRFRHTAPIWWSAGADRSACRATSSCITTTPACHSADPYRCRWTNCLILTANGKALRSSSSLKYSSQATSGGAAAARFVSISITCSITICGSGWPRPAPRLSISRNISPAAGRMTGRRRPMASSPICRKYGAYWRNTRPANSALSSSTIPSEFAGPSAPCGGPDLRRAVPAASSSSPATEPGRAGVAATAAMEFYQPGFL